MKTQEKKEFKAVEFQRKRRKELSELYNSNPLEFWNRLEKIRKKYRSKFRQTEKHTA
ncbi:MAG: hypothetical protein ABII90_08755 [Bacteroidota bacterium]